MGPCPKPPIHSDSSVPVLFFNMPYQFRDFGLLASGNNSLVLGGAEEGGVYLLGDLSMWEGEYFFQVGEMRKFLAACTHLPVVGKILDDLTYLRWFDDIHPAA